MIRWIKRFFNAKPEKSYIQYIRYSHNKDVNVIISDKHEEADIEGFFGGEEVLLYPKGTSIGRILIDTRLAKSWSEVNGGKWKDYQIPDGFTTLYLNGLKIQGDDEWNKRTKWSNFAPHKLTILKWEDKEL